MTIGARGGWGWGSHMEKVEMLGVSFRDVNCKLRYSLRVWRFGGQCINKPIPTLPEICVNEWAMKDKEQLKERKKKTKASKHNATCLNNNYYKACIRLSQNAIFERGARGKELTLCFPLDVQFSDKNHCPSAWKSPPPLRHKTYRYVVQMALKCFPVSARYHFYRWLV